MGDLMNGLLRQRMVGLAVLLVLVFLLSLLLPETPKPEEAEPSTTVTITGEQVLTEADAVPPPDDMLPEPIADALPAAEPSVAIADVEASAAPEMPAPAPAASATPSAGLKLAPKVGAHRQQDSIEPKPPAKPKPPVVAAVVPKPKLAESVSKPPSNSPPSAAGWYVQIGSFSDPGSAETIVTLLKKIGVSAAITRITGVKGNPLNRVRAGPYASETTAKAAHAKIAKNGYPQSRIVQEPSR